MERINKIDDMGVDHAKTDFTMAMKEICEEYYDKGTKKEDFMPDIDDGKSRSCIDESILVLLQNGVYCSLKYSTHIKLGFKDIATGNPHIFSHNMPIFVNSFKDTATGNPHILVFPISKYLVSNIVFVHFPMSFTTSTNTKEHYESVFVKHSIYAYILQPHTCNIWEAYLEASLL